MFIGILLVLAACFVWGFIFVIPQLLLDFNPIEVALGRYICFGLLSLLFMFFHGLHRWRSLPSSVWLKAFMYAFIVNIFYYSSLVIGLRYSNPSVIALICGISPITISFYGNWQQRACSFHKLILPSCFIASGLILVNLPTFLTDQSPALNEYLFGLLCGFLALAAWNWYVIANAKFLRENSHLPASDWANLIGVSTLVWVLILVSFFILIQSNTQVFQKYLIWTPELKSFLLGILVLGLACSWLGSYLWNRATQSLPMSLAGQLTIFETIFGLIFVYLVEQRMPYYIELVGISLLLMGVVLSMKLLRKSSFNLEESSTLQAA